MGVIEGILAVESCSSCAWIVDRLDRECDLVGISVLRFRAHQGC